MGNFLTFLTQITNKSRPDAIYPHFFVVKILIHFLTRLNFLTCSFFYRYIFKKKLRRILAEWEPNQYHAQ